MTLDGKIRLNSAPAEFSTHLGTDVAAYDEGDARNDEDGRPEPLGRVVIQICG